MLLRAVHHVVAALLVLRADALAPPTLVLTRRALLPLAAAGFAAPALADEEDEEDELASLVGSASGVKKRTKPGEAEAAKKYSAADVSYAYADVVAARQGMGTIDSLLRASDVASVAPLLGRPPFSSFKANAQALTRGPTLGPDEKKQIGNEKRFGLAADVLIMLGGLQDAVDSGDAAKAKGFAAKAAAALDEVIAVCKAGGL